MVNKKGVLLISGSILAVTIVLFATGSSLLTKNVLGIPFGNILIWIGFMALQLFFFNLNDGFKKSTSLLGKILRWIMRALIIIAILWFAIAYILSGNVNFNFSSTAEGYLGSPKASVLFWNIVYGLVILPVAVSIIYRIMRIIEIRKERN